MRRGVMLCALLLGLPLLAQSVGEETLMYGAMTPQRDIRSGRQTGNPVSELFPGLSSSTWSFYGTTGGASSVAAGPFIDTLADGIVGDAGVNFYGVDRGYSVASGTYRLSMIARAGDQPFASMWFYSSSLSNGVMFDLANGVVGNEYITQGNPVGAISPVGDGWYRCTITATIASPDATAAIGIYASSADYLGNATQTDAYAGDGETVNTYVYRPRLDAP